MNIRILIGQAVAVSALVVACESEAPKAPAAAPEEEVAPIESVPEDVALEEASEVAYAYSPIGKRDPFRSIFEEIRKEVDETELTELQRYEVDQLRLTGIITGRATPYAMVEDPEKKGHTLTRGTLIGKNWGRVSAITPDCVIIKEEYRDYTGRKVENKIELCLPAEEKLKLD
ncbi:MAG: pilus assembly protein PilP [Deltaproteobacteria bacterium]|nr:pilus assembly protein PilP [Deltaproteobacteria bacterium]